MSTIHTLPGPVRRAPRPAGPMSKVERSRLVLLGTSAIISAVLLLWLILSPMFAPPRRPLTILAGSLGAPDVLPGASSMLADDGRRIADRARSGARVEVGRKEFEHALGDFVGRKGSSPIVIYLAAVGVSLPGDSEGTRAYFLTSDGSLGSKKALVSAADLVSMLQGKKGPPILLILDASLVGSDRELGVFGNGFLAQLTPLLRRDGNLAVLTSCAPGQVSWYSEADHRSVFSRYVAEGLSGKATRWGRISVQGLHRYVQAGVSSWAERHRDGAIQTPLLLGNDRLDFTLTRLDAPAGSPGPEAKADEASEALKARWEARALLAKSAPYRHAPTAWRRYQDALLRAERMVRAGDPAGALKALSAADDLKARIASLSGGPKIPRPHSLALLESQDDRGESDSSSKATAYHRAIDRAIEGTGVDAEADTEDGAKVEEEPAAPPEEAPEDEPEKAPAKPAKAPAKPAKAPTKPEKAPAKPAKAPKAPSAATKAPADSPKAGRPQSSRADLAAHSAIADLTGGLVEGPPTFVEGQLSLWYATFVASGGESEALRKERLGLLHRAVDVRFEAEKAAAPDVKTLPWVRDLVDQADSIRRQAQDQLFAGEAASFKNCASRLARAKTSYERASQAAVQYARAIELVQRLQDELPYYGDWQASRPEGLDDSFEKLLGDAASLAKLLDAGPGKESESDEARRKLAALVQECEQGSSRLIADFRADVDRASAKSATPGWREVDALLRVPMIPAVDRPTLLERAATAGPASEAESEPADLAEASKTDPDPGFWKRARALARLEVGLLKLGGKDVRDLADWQEQAWSSRDKNPSAAFDALDRFSARVRELRETRARGGREEAEPVNREDGEPNEQVLHELAAADRSARALPAGAAPDLAGDPTRRLDEFLIHTLLVWHARRLDEDFAPEHAERLLEEARQFASSKSLWEEFGRAHGLTEAALIVKGPSNGRLNPESNQDLTLQISGEGDIPKGFATLMLAHDPKASVKTVIAGEGSLIPVPVEPAHPAARSMSLATTGHDPARAKLALVPEVFYRGRQFAAEGVELPDQENLVKVELRQQRLFKNVPDQFLLNPGKGFLHERTSLDYKVLVTSKTGRKLDAYVTYTLDGLTPEGGLVTLEGRKADDSLKGRIMSSDLPEEAPKALTITVNEGGPDGRPLCKPTIIPFRKVHPRTYIEAIPGLRPGVFQVWVSHLAGADPVPLPADVWVAVVPATSFRELRPSIHRIQHGQRWVFEFEIAPGTKTAEWSVGAEGVNAFIKDKFVLEE